VPDDADWVDLAVNHIEVAGLYLSCQARHKALIDALKDEP
jgi:hypothetical protein